MVKRGIIANLWFDDEAEEAAHFYASIFENVTIGRTDHYADAGKEIHGHNAGDVLTVEFEIEGQKFIALNGGPQFKINPSISCFVYCRDENEVNMLWEKLSDSAEVRMPLGSYPFSKRYGWLSDKFGVSWQLSATEDEVPHKIALSLMFTQDKAGKAEEAMQFYTSLFPDSHMGMISRYAADQEPDKEGTVSYGTFTVLGQDLIAMDSAQRHDFHFNEGVSLMVECETQQEVDEYWQKMSAVPEAEACGWLQDKYGVSWQITPVALNDMMHNGTPEQVERVMAAFMPMKKIDIATLERAYNGS